MPLIDDIKQLCDRLDPLGWRDLLLAVTGGALDIRQPSAAALKTALTTDLPAIDRSQPGFEDFAVEGGRGIEPGQPARSLLLHALASPNVRTKPDGTALGGFPTLRELEVAENYVYGAVPPSLQDLRLRAGPGNLLAIVVFAYEYRPAPETVHRLHSDLCFSRTGVARVGTTAPAYEAERRGFTPFVAGQPNEFRVLPARYAAWIAVQLPGERASFGPMRFDTGADGQDDSADPGKSDTERLFWVPLHKLFNGPECLSGFDLAVTLKATHVNEKLRRVHLVFGQRGLDGGWHEPDISQPPFVFTDGIAELSTDADSGEGLVVPAPHAALVEEAAYQGQRLTYRVPPDGETFHASVYFQREPDGTRLAPEYLHARHRLQQNGTVQDLNTLANPDARVQTGNYRALHYLDFSGDGWVEALCPQLATELPRRIAAYSLVTAPDYFPDCDQRELLEWTITSVPTHLRAQMWRIPPESLCDDRIPPNVQLAGAGFRIEDETATTIVFPPGAGAASPTSLHVGETRRHSALPDAAAGVFAPGWDVSYSRDPSSGERHLAAFALGSPFPEDAKLCAALSTFWPAVAPDAAREFQPDTNWPTVAPLTDEETGQVGSAAWDGVPGPKITGTDAQRRVEYINLDHADYVQNALDGKFSLALTGQVDTAEYERRVLGMARVYFAMAAAGFPNPRREWALFSFRKVVAGDGTLAQAQTEAGASPLEGEVYRFHLYQHGAITSVPGNVKVRRVRISDELLFYVGSLRMLMKHDDDDWEEVPG